MQVRRLPWVALADISPAVQQAVLLAEDQRFMRHGGVDVSALATAAWDNLFSKKARGASTITMQLAGQLDGDLQAQAGGRSLRQKSRCARRKPSKTAGARRRFSRPT
jgi:penicillin-binding protein 1C